MKSNHTSETSDERSSRFVRRFILGFGILFGVLSILLLTPGSWGIQNAIDPFLPTLLGFSATAYSPGALCLCAVMYYWNSCSENDKRPFGFDKNPGAVQVLATWFGLTLSYIVIVMGFVLLSVHMRRYF